MRIVPEFIGKAENLSHNIHQMIMNEMQHSESEDYSVARMLPHEAPNPKFGTFAFFPDIEIKVLLNYTQGFGN